MDNKQLTDNFGHPVANNQNSLTAGDRGPILLQDSYLIEKLAHFNRERIPERVVHAKGAGAYGYFELNTSLKDWTKADFLQRSGEKTKVFMRFSTVGRERGSTDTIRDVRGVAFKFYTQEGNYDLVGNNTPVFFISDAIKFPDFVHSQKRNPANNLPDPNMVWDYFSLNPETTHQVTILFSDRGIPQSYRNMNLYGSHTFKWVNQEGKAFWVKYHFKPDAKNKFFTNAEANQINALGNFDYATADLYNHIHTGHEVVYHAYIQIMPYVDAFSYSIDPFDVTKVWSHKDYPLQEIGKLVLNENPQNYFNEVEQAAFSPSNFVPGIEASPDKLLQGRLFAYPDAQRYRLGVNYNQIPVNCPYSGKVNNYTRDGVMNTKSIDSNSPNYEPNSFNGPVEDSKYNESTFPVDGLVLRANYSYKIDDFIQAGELYKILAEDAKLRLISNIAESLSGANQNIQLRQLSNFYKANADYGLSVARKLNLEKLFKVSV